MGVLFYVQERIRPGIHRRRRGLHLAVLLHYLRLPPPPFPANTGTPQTPYFPPSLPVRPSCSRRGCFRCFLLLKDLNACDRSLTPWLLAMFHCPWYNSNIQHPGERMAVTAMRAMEPVLFQHKASLAISGHVHGEKPRRKQAATWTAVQ